MEPAASCPTLTTVHQLACYLPWLKVAVALRYALTFPWAPEAWGEIQQHIPGLLAEQNRIRRAGWFT